MSARGRSSAPSTGAIDRCDPCHADYPLLVSATPLEVRAADTQFDIDRTGAIAALIHCLVRIEAEREQHGIPSREALAESSIQASRHGLDAVLLDRAGARTPARQLAARALEMASRVAGELQSEPELAQIEPVLTEGTGADLQRRVFAQDGMKGLLGFLEYRTAALDQ